MKRNSNWLDQHQDTGLLIFRLFIGVRLIYGVVDNIFSQEHMKAFEAFLGANGFPFPLLSAFVSVYAQAIAGLLLITGWQMRWGALLIIVNFIVALVMVHWGQSFEEMTVVLFLIFSGVLLLFTGPGRYAAGRSASFIFEPQEQHDSVQQKRKGIRNNNRHIVTLDPINDPESNAKKQDQ
jgi:putative oxidoreductase